MRKPRKTMTKRKPRNPKLRIHKPKYPKRKVPTPRQLLRMVEPKITAPAGWSYQWTAPDADETRAELLSRLSFDGWIPVPRFHHAAQARTLKADKWGHIVFREMVLLMRDRALSDRGHANNRAAAIKQRDDHPAGAALYGEKGQRNKPAMVTVDTFSYSHVPDDAVPIKVVVPVTVTVSGHFQDTANALKLPIAEYVRRRVEQSGVAANIVAHLFPEHIREARLDAEPRRDPDAAPFVHTEFKPFTSR